MPGGVLAVSRLAVVCLVMSILNAASLSQICLVIPALFLVIVDYPHSITCSTFQLFLDICHPVLWAGIPAMLEENTACILFPASCKLVACLPTKQWGYSWYYSLGTAVKPGSNAFYSVQW